MYAMPITPTDIARAEKLLGIETTSLQLSEAAQKQIDNQLRLALQLGLDALEGRTARAPLAIVR
jgi:hypothetical protein